ncbi:hypothetical protein [Flavobacterium sp.]|jgi:hypothetical protein|uniref:hypothetical protein n=1 Tax=Flavobacterium sp. TaxID=239 RepID=UPI0037BEE3D1
MNVKKVFPLLLLLIALNCVAQNSVTTISTKTGTRYITNAVDFPIAGTYLFQGAEPIVELNNNGTGIYQLHELPKRAMIWGIECDESGALQFIKGFDNAAYTLWYQYSDSSDSDTNWNEVPFSIHFNTMKMFIQGERMKDYSGTIEK